MSSPKTIQLKNLLVLVSADDGRVSTETLTVKTPTPCNQKNAKGNLRSHEDLDSWREAAWETGARFRLGLGF